jgi:hypothetical protein
MKHCLSRQVSSLRRAGQMIEDWKEDEEEVVETTTEVSLSRKKVHDVNDTRTKKVQSWWSLSLVRSSHCGDASHAAETHPSASKHPPTKYSLTLISPLIQGLCYLYHLFSFTATSIVLRSESQSLHSTSELHRVVAPNIALHCFDAPTAQAVTSSHLATPMTA